MPFFLENGKHVLVEKPISRTLAEADQLIALADRSRLVLAVGHLERFNPAVEYVHQLVEKPRFIEIQRLGSFSPRSLDIDVILDLMIHDLDIILQWDRSGIKEIRASGVPVISQKIDIANVRLEFNSGLVANLTASRVSQDKTRKLRIFQKDLYISADYKERSVKMFQLQNGQIRENVPHIDDVEPLSNLWRNFYRTIAGEGNFNVSGRDGRAALQLALAILHPLQLSLMLEQFIRQQIEKKTFPGISILVADRGKILYDRHFGLKAVWPEPEPLAAGTLYDLASLTKPLVSAFLAVYLIEKKQWRLEDEVRRFFPTFTLPITVEQLLTHSAGFRPWHPFYLYHPQDDLTQITTLAGAARPGAMVLYSDIGYILLRRLLEKVSGTGFQDLARAVIIDRLRLGDTFFLVPLEKKACCAPTENGNDFERGMCGAEHETASACFPWRSGLIQGDVHDANSFYSGGSAGNAGLFSCTRDLFKMGLEFFPQTATLLKSESIALFWKNRTPWSVLHRSIGFKLNSSRPTSGGSALSKQAIGHNGFTGTSLWLEPETQRQWIILSNRIHPRVKKTNFDALRRKLHRLLKRELALP